MKIFIIWLILCRFFKSSRCDDIFVELTCNNKSLTLWVGLFCSTRVRRFKEQVLFLSSYTCEGNSLISNASVSSSVILSAVKGLYSTKGGEYCTKLLILDSNIRQLPNKISQFFPNLNTFGVVNSNLLFVKRGNFVSMETVKQLDLCRNKISTLPSDAFKDLKALRMIDLTGNEIKVLPSSAFTTLLYLMKFIINDNKIELFDFDIFRNNLRLSQIHLWGNKIKAIRFDAEKFSRLSIMDLRGNVCINEIYYLTSENPVLWLQREINLNCSSTRQNTLGRLKSNSRRP